MKSKKFSVRKIIGIICMAAGIAVLGGALYLYLHVENEIQQQNTNIEENLIALEEVDEVITEDVAGAEDTTDTMSVKYIDSVPYIGTLYIEGLSKTFPVQAVLEESLLNLGPARLSGTPAERNFVIGGHGTWAMFGGIDSLENGSMVYFKDVNDNVWKYSVVTNELLWPSELDALTDSDYDLSLFCCTWDNSKRIVVRLNLVSSQ